MPLTRYRTGGYARFKVISARIASYFGQHLADLPALAGTIRFGPGMAAPPAKPASAAHQGRLAGRSP